MEEIYFVYDHFTTSLFDPSAFRNNRLVLNYPIVTEDFTSKSYDISFNNFTKTLSIFKSIADVSDVYVLNLHGKIIFKEENCYFENKEIDFVSYSDGIYIVKLRIGEKIYTQKILKR